MQKARGHPLVHRPIGLPQAVGTWFQVLFTPLYGVLFTFPSRYSFTIGHQLVFSLGRWSSQLPTGFHVPRGTRVEHPGSVLVFRLRGSHPLWRAVPDASATRDISHFPKGPQPLPVLPHNPAPATLAGYHARTVWAPPRSLAATEGISVDFFSCGY